MTDKLNKYTLSETDAGTLLIKSESMSPREVQAPVGESMVINGAWYLDALPTCVVMERMDGTLAKFFLTPFRSITEKDLTPYKSYHPRKCKGQPLPDYLYKFYGLARNEESLSEVIRVRVSPSEKEKLEAAAENAKATVSEFIREIIRKEVSPMKKLSDAKLGDLTDRTCNVCGKNLELHNIDRAEGIAWISCPEYQIGNDDTPATMCHSVIPEKTNTPAGHRQKGG